MSCTVLALEEMLSFRFSYDREKTFRTKHIHFDIFGHQNLVTCLPKEQIYV